MAKGSTNSPTSVSKSIPFHFNLIALVVSFFFVMVVYKNVPSYTWVKDELIKENLKMIKKYSKFSFDDRIEAKIGFDYAVLRIIKNGTPENATILMPPVQFCNTLRANNKASKLNGGGIQSTLWCEYFLFPRKVVHYDSTRTKEENLQQYLAVLGGWGYGEFQLQGNGSGYEVIKLK